MRNFARGLMIIYATMRPESRWLIVKMAFAGVFCLAMNFVLIFLMHVHPVVIVWIPDFLTGLLVGLLA